MATRRARACVRAWRARVRARRARVGRVFARARTQGVRACMRVRSCTRADPPPGFSGKSAFFRQRYHADGSENAEFVLNAPQYRKYQCPLAPAEHPGVP